MGDGAHRLIEQGDNASRGGSKRKGTSSRVFVLVKLRGGSSILEHIGKKKKGNQPGKREGGAYFDYSNNK